MLFETVDGRMELRSYRVAGGTASLQTTKPFSNFEFDTPYSITIVVHEGTITVSLSDNLLPTRNEDFTISTNLHPVIGYYMGEDRTLNGKKAVADDSDSFPLVPYEDGERGPQLILLNMPDINP